MGSGRASLHQSGVPPQNGSWPADYTSQLPSMAKEEGRDKGEAGEGLGHQHEGDTSCPGHEVPSGSLP